MDLSEIQAAYYMVAATGVLVAAVYYIYNMNVTRKTQEHAQKTQELMLKAQEQSAKAQQQTLETRQAQMFMNIYQQATTKDFISSWNILMSGKWENYKEFKELR